MRRYPSEFAVDNVLPLSADADVFVRSRSLRESRTGLKCVAVPQRSYIIPIGHDQVDFTEAGIVITFQQLETLICSSQPQATVSDQWRSVTGIRFQVQPRRGRQGRKPQMNRFPSVHPEPL